MTIAEPSFRFRGTRIRRLVTNVVSHSYDRIIDILNTYRTPRDRNNLSLIARIIILPPMENTASKWQPTAAYKRE